MDTESTPSPKGGPDGPEEALTRPVSNERNHPGLEPALLDPFQTTLQRFPIAFKQKHRKRGGVETLTDGLGQGDDHVLAGRLLGEAADHPHHSIHPHFELHLGSPFETEGPSSMEQTTLHGTDAERQAEDMLAGLETGLKTAGGGQHR